MFISFLIITILLFSLSGCTMQKDYTSDSNNFNESIHKTSQIQENISTNQIITITDNNNLNNTTSNTSYTPPISSEEELATFHTKIYTKDSARQNNLTLTCSKLNGTIVKSGNIFSFTQTIGPATSSKGYQEADIFDSNGNKKKGLGGGNCQVSSTLYNAVLKVPTLKVVERHEHSNKVPYVKSGQDAAVAYGSVDFKFKNENSYSIKIYAEATSNKVTIKLVKI